MGFWNSNIRRPRPFSHQYIYSDPRKERLQKMEEEAKRSLERLDSEQNEEKSFEHLRGKFVKSSSHLRSHQKKTTGRIMALVLLVILLALLCNFLFRG